MGADEGDATMAKVTPFHSKAQNAPKRSHDIAPKQYHNNTACPEGAKIAPKHKVSGTGGYQQCPQCARL
jgi:hypothetical protein